MAIVRTILLVAGIAMLPMPANATTPAFSKQGKPTSVPEPTDLVLFAAGVAGLIIGRRVSRSRRRHDD